MKPIDILRIGAMAAGSLVSLARNVVAVVRGKPVPLDPVHAQSHTAEVRRQADEARADRQAREHAGLPPPPTPADLAIARAQPLPAPAPAPSPPGPAGPHDPAKN